MSNVFRPRKDPQQEMEEALDKAIALSAGKRHYNVTGGQWLYEQHRRYRYTFTLVEGAWDLPDSTDLQLSSADLINPLPVELSGTKDDTVTITVTQRLTESTLTSAQLMVDRSFLLRRLKEAFRRKATTAQLGLKLFGVLDSPDNEAASHLVDTIQNAFIPDESQRQALLRALASPLLVIQGPPGTGKTNVLAATALLHAILFGYRVLIVSHTNVSLDNAVICLTQFFRACGLEQWLNEQRLVRFKNPHLAKLEEEEYRTITLPLIVTDRVTSHREEMERVEQRRAIILKQLAEYREELPEQVQMWQQQVVALQRKCKQAERTLADLEVEERARLAPIMEQLIPRLDQRAKEEQTMKDASANWEEAARQLQPSQLSYQEQWTRYETINRKLEHLRKYPLVIRLAIQAWTGEQEKNLEVGIQTLTVQLHDLAEQIRELQQTQVQANDTYQQAERRRDILAPPITYWEREREARPAHAVEQQSTLTRQLSDLTQELAAGNPRIAEIERAIDSREQEVASLEETLALLDQQIADLKRETERQVVEEAQIVAATLTALYLNPVLLAQEWDVVLVDEASMASPLAVKVAADRAKNHLIIVGDPQQLAPVCPFKDDLVRRWLGLDVFAHGGYTLEEAEQGTHHCVLLRYQSRMHSNICDLVRGPVYQGRLKDRDPQAPRRAFQPEPEHAVVLYDTGNVKRAQAHHPDGGRSRYNEYHAELDLTLAEQVLSGVPVDERYAEYIGIVTPYTAQRECIKERMQGKDLGIYCRVGTVHAFQGMEFRVVIFDVVEAPGLRIAPFLREGWGSDAMRLLNVAVTRARDKLLIVAHLPHIRKQPVSSMLRQMMMMAAQKRQIPAETLLL
jgi:K+/H+ antiporter YhaU regulatory subunit KhtT